MVALLLTVWRFARNSAETQEKRFTAIEHKTDATLDRLGAVQNKTEQALHAVTANHHVDPENPTMPDRSDFVLQEVRLVHRKLDQHVDVGERTLRAQRDLLSDIRGRVTRLESGNRED